MGGQVGDTGELSSGGELWRIANTQKAGDAWLHFLADEVTLQLRRCRPPVAASRSPWTAPAARPSSATTPSRICCTGRLHEVVSQDATQKGSYVGPEKLTFDFSSAPLTPQQVADVERLVNERILENAPVTWTEAKYGDIKSRKDIMQFFGEKYGDVVRVVQIGGKPAALDGYSMELCGGTHTRATGEIGLFRIAAESAIAAGIRRIEAVSGLEAYKRANEELQLIKTVAGKVNSPVGELEKKIESLLAQQKELEKQLKAMQQKAGRRNSRAAWLPRPRPSARRRPSWRTSALPTAISCNPSPTRSRASSRAWWCSAARRTAQWPWWPRFRPSSRRSSRRARSSRPLRPSSAAKAGAAPTTPAAAART